MKTTGAIFTLIKDIILIAITFAIVGSIIGFDPHSGHFLNTIMAACLFGSLPFGWRWASKIITAVSLQGILIKATIAFFLGWIAVWVVLAGDIISLIRSLKTERG